MNRFYKLIFVCAIAILLLWSIPLQAQHTINRSNSYEIKNENWGGFGLALGPCSEEGNISLSALFDIVYGYGTPGIGLGICSYPMGGEVSTFPLGPEVIFALKGGRWRQGEPILSTWLLQLKAGYMLTGEDQPLFAALSINWSMLNANIGWSMYKDGHYDYSTTPYTYINSYTHQVFISGGVSIIYVKQNNIYPPNLQLQFAPQQILLIEKNQQKSLNVTISNDGGSIAKEINMMFSIAPNNFQNAINLTVPNVGDIAEGTTKDVPIQIKAIKDLLPGGFTLTVSGNDLENKTHFTKDIFIQTKQQYPPYLVTAIDVKDTDGDKVFAAGERVTLKVKVKNSGKGDAYKAKVVLESLTPDLKPFEGEKEVGYIKAGETVSADFTASVPISVPNGRQHLSVKVLEGGGYNSEESDVVVNTKAAIGPVFRILGKIDDDDKGQSFGNSDGSVDKGETIELHLSIVNDGPGIAKNVKVGLVDPPGNVDLVSPEVSLGDMQIGTPKEAVLAFSVKSVYAGNVLPLTFSISEQTGIFGVTKVQELAVRSRKSTIEIGAPTGVGQVAKKESQFSFLASSVSTPKTTDSRQGKLSVAVRNIESRNISTDVSNNLMIETEKELVNCRQFNVCERNRVDEILKQQAFQQTGACADDGCLVELGRLLPIQKIIGIQVSKVGLTYILYLRLIDLKTGTIERLVSAESEDVRILRSSELPKAVGELIKYLY